MHICIEKELSEVIPLASKRICRMESDRISAKAGNEEATVRGEPSSLRRSYTD